MVNNRKKPKFVRWTYGSRKALKAPWRKPQGINSKILEQRAGKIKMPSVSYGAPRNLRFLHPSGFSETLVHNTRDLEKIKEKEAVRIASSVGKKKKTEIVKKAQEMKLKILNP